MDIHIPRESLAEDNLPLLGEMMWSIAAYIVDGRKEDMEDHFWRESLAEDHSSLLGEMMQRIISSFSQRDNFGRKLCLLGEEEEDRVI